MKYVWEPFYDIVTNKLNTKVQQLMCYTTDDDPWPHVVAEVAKLKRGCQARFYGGIEYTKFSSTKKAKAWVLAIVTLENIT